MHILVYGVPIFYGMAGSKRIQNHLKYFFKTNNILISNLFEIDEYPCKEFPQNILLKVIINKNNGVFKILRSIFKQFVCIYGWKTKDNKNIFYVYGYPDIKNIFIILFAKILGYQIIFDIVEDRYYTKLYKNTMSKFRIKTSIFFIKYIYLLSNFCIVITDHLNNKIKEITRNKIYIYKIPVSVDLDYFDEVKNKSIQPVIDNRITKIFYGGSFGEKDGLFYLIEAVQKLSIKGYKLSLTMSGKGAKRNEEKVLSYIRKSDLDGIINYVSYLEDMEYVQYLWNSDVFCVTRTKSDFANAGFPFKVGEYLATGRPLIVSNVSEVSNYLVDKESAILIKPNSAVEIITALEFVINNKGKALKIGEKGRKVAEKYFNASKISQELYEKLTSL